MILLNGMKKILNQYSDCDVFSLTGEVSGLNVTEEEFVGAINKMEQTNKEVKRKQYNENQIANCPDYEVLYEEIKKECFEFDCEQNKEKYLNKHFDAEMIQTYKAVGFSDEKIEEIKKDFFHCSFITDEVGKTTKYGKENPGFFWHLYHDIALNIDRSKTQEKYCTKDGKNPVEVLPNVLKNNLLYYEMSFSNAVTTSSILKINYYFKLNDETKKYLCKFKNDFALKELQDLTLYKNDEIKFYSCTHERYNSINIKD